MNGADDDIYVMTNAYWEELQFRIQEGTAQDWVRIVDTSLLTPDNFAELGVPLKHATSRRFMRGTSGRYAKAEGLFSPWAMGEFGRNLGAKSPFIQPQ